MTAGAEPAAVLAGVTHRYGAVAALDDVAVSFAAGRMIGLVGPDGVGKSTLLGLIAGVRRLQTGRVRVLGGDIADSAHRSTVHSRVAYMPQGLGRNLYPTLSVRENVDFFGRLYGQSAAERDWRIADLLRSTGLDPFAHRPAGKLSGGMKQKLSLCCSLIHDPDLLILDEPTTGVDPLSRRQFWELIERIRQRGTGMTIVTATAYMSEAETFEDLVAMDDGRILATGSPADFRERTGKEQLEEAFIALLPAAKRAGHQAVTLPPRQAAKGPPAIEAEGLSMRFGDFTAVDKVSFRIERGEIFGFLGSNGCGKTTTMKMLTGLLPPTEGTASLFGRTVEGDDLAIRRRVGYMSQSFSLYGELSVWQNIDLHAALFQLPKATRADRIAALLERFGLAEVKDSYPAGLPLGVRQRLQLAVAVLHQPEILILDEPTSGVDPIARDRFWELLIQLSREEGVTIFISTHFMNEAERCDRISLMHAGRVLAVGTPDALREERGAATLEEAFIAYLAEAAGEPAGAADATPAAAPPAGMPAARRPAWLSPARALAFARRENTELLRDPIRLAFALLGPLVLMLTMSFGISFDVERLTFAALDQDRTPESRLFLRQLTSSRYFEEQPELASFGDLDQAMLRGEITIGVVVPPGFGRDLLTGRAPEIGIWLDGSNTVRAESGRRYAEGAFLAFLGEWSMTETGRSADLYPAALEPRFRYNQAFESLYAIPPGILTMMLIMIPNMLTALGVVREKETGSITNLYAAPVRKIEFLLGKQLPYIGVAFVSFLILLAVMLTIFGLQVQGSLFALVSGVVLYITAATAFGLVVSTFVRSQIAAIFASAIIVMIPTVNFSGMIYPIATLDPVSRFMGGLFPPLYFQKISTGVFNKGLDFADLYWNHLALAAFCIVFWAMAALLLKKQEA